MAGIGQLLGVGYGRTSALVDQGGSWGSVGALLGLDSVAAGGSVTGTAVATFGPAGAATGQVTVVGSAPCTVGFTATAAGGPVAITFVAGSNTGNAASVSSLAVDVPTGVASGDIVVAFLGQCNGGGGPSINHPSVLFLLLPSP